MRRGHWRVGADSSVRTQTHPTVVVCIARVNIVTRTRAQTHTQVSNWQIARIFIARNKTRNDRRRDTHRTGSRLARWRFIVVDGAAAAASAVRVIIAVGSDDGVAASGAVPLLLWLRIVIAGRHWIQLQFFGCSRRTVWLLHRFEAAIFARVAANRTIVLKVNREFGSLRKMQTM